MEKVPATVEILSFNNEATVEKTLESVAAFGEILVIDGGSTDRTLEIARRHGAKIITQDEKAKSDGRIVDFAQVRNQGLEASKHDWFLFIDSDEMLTPELAAEIRDIATAERPSFHVWNVPRKYVLDGAVIDCATTYPNIQPRLFHRDYVEGFVKPIHERIRPRPGVSAGTLENHMLVPLLSPMELWAKWRRYLELEEKRWGSMPRGEVLRKAASALKPIVLYLLRLPRRLFCKGRAMPLSYEFLYQRYNFALLFKLLAKLI